jgi:methyltransferase FkbM-like protein
VTNNNRWLLEHAANVNSQTGEDGIIAKTLEVIGEPRRWCVEFGAWDGRHLSNTYDLVSRKEFSAVLIEGSPRRYRDLAATFAGNPKVTTINAFVGFGPGDGLDAILARTPIPEDFDVLSIDIDGNDYHVWKAVTRYRPRVVVIEYNPTIPSAVDFVQAADPAVNHGSSIAAQARLGREKGYELVAVTLHNCVLVRSEYFAAFGIADNSVQALRADESMVTYIFNGFDGTVFVRGSGKLGWHNVPYRESRLQHVARVFRKFPDNFGPVMKVLAKHYRSLKKRRLI